MSDEFARNRDGDWDLTLGSVIGTRSFTWNETSEQLTGIVHTVPWHDGENEAICDLTGKKHDPHASTSYCKLKTTFKRDAAGRMYQTDICVLAEHQVNARCDRNDPNCTCGIYAYWDGSDDYGSALGGWYSYDPKVSAVIEGYGKTVVGTRGFRCSKAKILALLLPEPAPVVPDPSARDLDKERADLMASYSRPLRFVMKDANNRGDVGAGLIFTLSMFTLLLGVSAGLGTLIPAIATGSIIFSILGGILLTIGIIGGVFLNATYNSIDVWYSEEYRRAFRPEDRLSRAEDRLAETLGMLNPFPSGIPRGTYDKIVAKYPSAQIFHSREEMMAAFPTSDIKE